MNFAGFITQRMPNSKMYKLYQSAFPSSERRNLGGLEQILNHEKRFEAYALMKEDKFVGFFTYWLFDRFCYVEHFAIDDSLRGQNLGSEVLVAFLKRTDLPVVLEVEMPDNNEAGRRIKFYERFGFRVLPHTYAQPFYDGSGRILPMLIMSNNYHFTDKHFNMIKKTLHSEVYHYTLDE